MARDADRDQDVAGALGPGKALTLEPELLAVADAGRNLDLDLFSRSAAARALTHCR
jgi:hypothetical protein